MKAYGVQLAVEMIRKLWAVGVRGFHFCTLNLEKSVHNILEELDWLDRPQRRAIEQVESRASVPFMWS